MTMTKQQFIEEFRRMSQKTKVSLLRELLEKEISDELREDFSDYLLALEADKEEGAIPFDEYIRSRGAEKKEKMTRSR